MSVRPPTAQSSRRAVVAEDHYDLRLLICEALRSDGFDVVECVSGIELLRTLRGETLAHREPELIVTDVRMPGCSGLQALEDLRWMGWSTPVLVITAFSDAATRERTRELDAELLDKPFDLGELRARASAMTSPRSAVVATSGRLVDRTIDRVEPEAVGAVHRLHEH